MLKILKIITICLIPFIGYGQAITNGTNYVSLNFPNGTECRLYDCFKQTKYGDRIVITNTDGKSYTIKPAMFGFAGVPELSAFLDATNEKVCADAAGLAKLDSMVANVTVDSNTKILTVTLGDGSTAEFDLCALTQITVNTGETDASADGAGGSVVIDCDDALHFWSSDAAINVTVTEGSAKVDLMVDEEVVASKIATNTTAIQTLRESLGISADSVELEIHLADYDSLLGIVDSLGALLGKHLIEDLDIDSTNEDDRAYIDSLLAVSGAELDSLKSKLEADSTLLAAHIATDLDTDPTNEDDTAYIDSLVNILESKLSTDSILAKLTVDPALQTLIDSITTNIDYQTFADSLISKIDFSKLTPEQCEAILSCLDFSKLTPEQVAALSAKLDIKLSATDTSISLLVAGDTTSTVLLPKCEVSQPYLSIVRDTAIALINGIDTVSVIPMLSSKLPFTLSTPPNGILTTGEFVIGYGALTLNEGPTIPTDFTIDYITQNCNSGGPATLELIIGGAVTGVEITGDVVTAGALPYAGAAGDNVAVRVKAAAAANHCTTTLYGQRKL